MAGPRTDFYLEDDAFERFKPGEDLGMSDPTWSGGAGAKFGATSTGATEPIKKIAEPIGRVIPTIMEHAEQGLEGMTGEYPEVSYSEGWRSLEEPAGRLLGGIQYLASPISGAYSAFFDDPVSATLQEHAGMDKETADMTAMGLSLALTGGLLGYAKWARLNPFASEVLMEKLFGGKMPGTHWAQGTTDADQTRRAILKAGAATTAAAAVPPGAGLIGRLAGTGARAGAAVSPVLSGIGFTITNFISDLRSLNAKQIDIDMASRQATIDRRGRGAHEFRSEMPDEEARIIRNVENDNYYDMMDLPGNEKIVAIDDVFNRGAGTRTPVEGATGVTGYEIPHISWREQGLLKRLEEDYITEHAGVSRFDETGRELTGPDAILRVMDNPSPWTGRPQLRADDAYESSGSINLSNSVRQLEYERYRAGGLPDGQVRFIEDDALWKYNQEVRDRAHMGITNQSHTLESWDEALKAIQWYQRNDPEALVRILQQERDAWKALGDAPYIKSRPHPEPSGIDAVRAKPYPVEAQLKLLDDLIAETKEIIKPLKKAERGRAPSPGSVQERLARAEEARLKREADKTKKKEDGFSLLDPMGWRKHPWFGGKE